MARGLGDAWTDEREALRATAGQLTEHLEKMAAGGGPTADALSTLVPAVLEASVQHSLQQFDATNGGFGGAPKFPHPMQFEGSELELNYSTWAVGSVRVEIQDADGNALPGYGLEDCPKKFGDEIEGIMTWNGGAGLGDLAGTPVRLRVALKDADLYAFRFR